MKVLSKEELITAIRENFSDVSPPTKISNSEVGSEPKDVERFFKNKKWAAITWHLMRSEYPNVISSTLHFMTDDAYRYYIPAFMIMSLNNLQDMDVTYDYIISSLTLPSKKQWPEKSDEAFHQRFDNYTSGQKKVIASYLFFMIPDLPLTIKNVEKIAYDSYWHQFA